MSEHAQQRHRQEVRRQRDLDALPQPTGQLDGEPGSVASETMLRRSFLQRWMPHPLLTLVLVLLWMALLNSFTVGGLLMGILLGMLIPIYTAHFWPERPVVRSPHKALIFIAIVAFDMIVANIQVAYLILFRPVERLHNRWITVPLDLTSPEAITVLVGTITLTPGTVASDLAADGSALLMYCLDVKDEEELVQRIKQRYERRIGEFLP
jgi:multicomponent K+:H+ antiporter subunit E